MSFLVSCWYWGFLRGFVLLFLFVLFVLYFRGTLISFGTETPKPVTIPLRLTMHNPWGFIWWVMHDTDSLHVYASILFQEWSRQLEGLDNGILIERSLVWILTGCLFLFVCMCKVLCLDELFHPVVYEWVIIKEYAILSDSSWAFSGGSLSRGWNLSMNRPNKMCRG